MRLKNCQIEADCKHFWRPLSRNSFGLSMQMFRGKRQESVGEVRTYEKEDQRTMTIYVPSLSRGNLGHGHRSSPQEQIFRGP